MANPTKTLQDEAARKKNALTYEVLDMSTTELGGVKVDEDRTIKLSPKEAEYWLTQGAIVRQAPHPAKRAPAAPAAAVVKPPTKSFLK